MMRWTSALVVMLLVGGCASHRVNCDNRLEPINPPHAKPVLEKPQ